MATRRSYRVLFMFFATIIFIPRTFSQQSSCPANIGFEDGSFNKWECSAGRVLPTGIIDVLPTPPGANVHTIYDNNTILAKDPYGNFPVNCPNGSRYSIKLGNDLNGAQAERVSYTFDIPAGQNDYSIIYNYAVVFQNPNHSEFQQPRFTSRIFDVSSNQYVSCGSFEFVASSGLLGFQQSAVGQNVFYKPWSPITINLNGYAGKTIRLEFTNNDCTLGGHFGYAYLDVNENCSAPVTGNVYCNGSDSIRLKAPFGFQEYRWYNADFSQLLGNSNTLLISPPPPPNTVYALEIIPYPNLGCIDTLFSRIVLSPESFVLQVKDSIQVCAFSTADLTAPAVTAGSSPGLKYTYFLDYNETNYLPNPSSVSVAGDYYVKAINNTGCNEIRKIKVVIRNPPLLTIANPPEACFPATADLTTRNITASSDPGLVYTYWKDSTATTALADPASVQLNGTYYIKGANSIGCFNIKPVQVSIANITLTNQTACGQADITKAIVTSQTSPNLTFSYWRDVAATNEVSNPGAVTNTGSYFIKAINTAGCSILKPVQVTVHPLPTFEVSDPLAVVFPAIVDLSRTFQRTSGVEFTYWQNTQATSVLPQPLNVGVSGTYFIKAKNQFGCQLVKPVRVVINPPPFPKLIAPNAFSPNDDGVNDLFRPKIDGEVVQYHLRIMNRWGQEMYDTPDILRYWNGKLRGKNLPAGTYYWVFEGIDLYRKSKIAQSGSITLIR